jgi:hypothetical protein
MVVVVVVVVVAGAVEGAGVGVGVMVTLTMDMVVVTTGTATGEATDGKCLNNLFLAFSLPWSLRAAFLVLPTGRYDANYGPTCLSFTFRTAVLSIHSVK